MCISSIDRRSHSPYPPKAGYLKCIWLFCMNTSFSTDVRSLRNEKIQISQQCISIIWGIVSPQFTTLSFKICLFQSFIRGKVFFLSFLLGSLPPTDISLKKLFPSHILMEVNSFSPSIQPRKNGTWPVVSCYPETFTIHHPDRPTPQISLPTVLERLN